jgi:hypothetical protein
MTRMARRRTRRRPVRRSGRPREPDRYQWRMLPADYFDHENAPVAA